MNCFNRRWYCAALAASMLTLFLMACGQPATDGQVVQGTATARPPTPTRTTGSIHPGMDEIGDFDNVIVHTQVAGFLIITGGKRILIDALFQVHNPPSPAERVVAMREGLPPFNDIDLILVTHTHEDHFDANLVGNNMLNNPQAVFVSSEVAVSVLEDRFRGFEQIQDRVIGVRLGRGEQEQMIVAGIDLDIICLSHGVPSVPNLGYIFSADDISFFHTGDMNPNYVTVSDLHAYGLPERQIDIALVSGYHLTRERFADYFLEGIQPTVKVPMHFNFSGEGVSDILSEIETEFPNAILFREEMTWQAIDPGMLE